MQIVPLILSDQDAVARFWSDIYDELGWKKTFNDGFDDIPAFFHFPEGFLLVIKDSEGKIMGSGGVVPFHDATGILKKFYLTPLLRAKGIAKQLLERLIEEAKKKDFTRLVLDVYYTNTRAAKFYEKQGFEKYNQTPDPKWGQTTAPDKFSYYQINIS